MGQNAENVGGGVAEIVRYPLRISNESGSAVLVSVSKTLSAGQDGDFSIPPGANEEWKRHVGYRVTIKWHGSSGDGSVNHVMGPVVNHFHINQAGDRLIEG